MKIKMLREHYYTTDNGLTWNVKKSFDSSEEAEALGFLPSKWHPYECGHCKKFHVAKVKRDSDGS